MLNALSNLRNLGLAARTTRRGAVFGEELDELRFECIALFLTDREKWKLRQAGQVKCAAFGRAYTFCRLEALLPFEP